MWFSTKSGDSCATQEGFGGRIRAASPRIGEGAVEEIKSEQQIHVRSDFDVDVDEVSHDQWRESRKGREASFKA